MASDPAACVLPEDKAAPFRPIVIFIHPSDEMYGSDRSLLGLVRLSSDVCRPIVMLPNDLAYEGKLSGALREAGVEVITGPVVVLRRSYLHPMALPRWIVQSALGFAWMVWTIRREKPALIVSNTGAVPVGPMVARILGLHHVWYLREMVTSPRWFRPLIRRLAGLPKGVIVTNSRAVLDWLGEIGRRRSIVIYNAVEVTDEATELPEAPTAVFIGRISPGKGWDVFVDAAVRVHLRNPTARFVLAGGLPPGSPLDEGQVRRVIAEADPDEVWLTWLGPIDNPRRLVRDSWIAVIPSRTPEGLGNVALEAMAEGRAVVGSRIGGVTETVVHSATGLLVPPNDADALTEALACLLGDRELTETMGKAGLQFARVRFSMDRLALSWQSLLRSELPTDGSHGGGSAG